MKRDVPHFRIGLLLTEAGILEPRQLDNAISQGEQAGLPFLKILVDQGSLRQPELQAVIQAQSLIWSGALDVEKAIRVLAIVHDQNVSFDEGLLSIGWQKAGSSNARVPVSSSGFKEGKTEQAVPLNSSRFCQYCATPLPFRSNSCSYCTGENSPLAVSFKDRLPQLEKAQAMVKNQTRVKATSPPRDPVVMAFLSGCCLPGLGQILLGQFFKGACLFLLLLLTAIFTAGVSSLFLNPLVAIDAYLLADKLRNRKTVGLWESF